MLDQTNIKRQSISKVVKYYSDGADDYYAKEGESHAWFGKGAEELGLKGEVDQKRFAELLDGQIDKNTKLRRFKAGEAEKERIGMDLTFNAPKSVSLQALVYGDAKIIAAHDAAVKATLMEAETLAKARRTEKKQVHIEETGNIVAATFRHETNREQEPHLHTHAVLMNMTRREDGEWRALMNDSIVKNIEYLSNIYNRNLARELENQGFQIRYGENGAFDLAHISRDQIEAFSTRSKQIETKLAEQGLNRETASADQKSMAALQTRKKKVSAEREALHESWKERSRDLGIDFESREWAGAGKEGAQAASEANKATLLDKEKPEKLADQAISHAVRSLGERQTNIGEKLILNAAMRHAPNSVTHQHLKDAMDRAIQSGYLVPGEGAYAASNMRGENGKPVVKSRSAWERELTETTKDRDKAKALVSRSIDTGRLSLVDRQYTTSKAIALERTILKMEREGRGAVWNPISDHAIKTVLETKTLSKEQKAAVEMIATTQNRYVGVQGYAGVGKSYLTQSAKEVIEKSGLKMKIIAPYGNQVESLQADGMDAKVMAAFLRGKDKGLDKDTVLFLDEAGVVPANQMLAVMKEVEKAGARLVLLGDTSQTKAIEAGKPFEQLLNTGMETAYVTEIQRQKDNPELLKAVQYAAEKNTSASIRHVETIHQIKEDGERHQKLAEDYSELGVEGRMASVIVTGTNASRKDINNRVREALGLVGQGETVTMLSRHDSTQAERQHSKYYAIGTVIVPEQNQKTLGLVRGQQYEVIDNGPDNLLTVKNTAGEVHSFCPEKANISVYEQEQGELAVGDSVRFTRNDKDLDVRNGNKFFVASVEEGRIGLSKTPDTPPSLYVSNADRLFLQPGYATTAHSAQGITREKAFLNIDTNSRTTVMETYYVALSRAKQESVIYTNDKGALPQAIARETVKTTALDLKIAVTPIHQITTTDTRYQKITEDYLRLGRQGAEKAVIITGDNESRKELNQLVRASLKLKGTGPEIVTMLSPDDTPAASLESAKAFKIGTIIEPEKGNKALGLEKGKPYEVIKTGWRNRLTVQTHDGQKITFNPKQIRCRTYEQEKSDLAPGDSVRVTRTDKALNLKEGERLHVAAVQDGKLYLSKKAGEKPSVELSTKEPLFIQPAYAAAAHSSKAITGERSWLNVDTRTKLKDMEAYCARLKDKTERIIFTNDVKMLTDRIASPVDRGIALKQVERDRKREERSQERDEHEAQHEQTEAKKNWLHKLKSRIIHQREHQRELPAHEKAKASRELGA